MEEEIKNLKAEIETLKERAKISDQMERAGFDSAAFWKERADFADAILEFYDNRKRDASQAEEQVFISKMEKLIAAWKAQPKS